MTEENGRGGKKFRPDRVARVPTSRRPRPLCAAQRAAGLCGRFQQRLGARFLRRRDTAGRECALRLGAPRVGLRGDRGAELLALRDIVEPAERALQVLEHGEESLAAFVEPLAREQTGEKFDTVAQLLGRDAQFVALLRVECFYF